MKRLLLLLCPLVLLATVCRAEPSAVRITSPHFTLITDAGDFTRIELTSDNARTADALNPCTDFNGRTARITYAETADKTADGQIVSIQLRM